MPVPRAELVRLFARLQNVAEFRDYVKTLQAQREDAVSDLLYEPQPANVEVMRGRARMLDELLKSIMQNHGMQP